MLFGCDPEDTNDICLARALVATKELADQL